MRTFCRHSALLLVAFFAAADVSAAPAKQADGYRGIWYMNQPTGDEHRYKYSGGLGTYPQQHTPIAVYSATANKTFFCYGGATDKPNELACVVAYYDHATGQVPRPRIVLTKPTGDAHENPTLQIDETGHVWVFCNTHGPAKNSYIFRSAKPCSIDEFEQVSRMNFSYSQPWVVPGEGFLFLHTRYQGGRQLHWMTSADGREWSSPAPMAAIAQGHYQVSNRHGQRVATAFNYHPREGGLNARTNIYYMETDNMGAAWQTAAGEVVTTPLSDPRNAALVHDFEADDQLVYLKDLNFDAAGRPVILFLTTGGYAPGPAAGEREWFTAHWTGDRWQRRPFTTSDHNYDYGSLHVEGDEWRIIAPTEPGPQPHGTGGEMALWTSRDEGRSWLREKQLTHHSEFNHTYARRPVNAHRQFYAVWADGNPLEPSESRLYFTDREGSHVWRLPANTDGEFFRPDVAY
jgi:BNR repeat-containing family member